MSESTQGYGKKDATYKALGSEQGIRQLVSDFYDIMGSDPRFSTIFDWHPKPDDQSRDKLARFLCGWTGGPRLYKEKYGSISIPAAHAHLHVSSVERDQWLQCMTDALEKQPYPEELKQYMISQLSIPAERIRETSKP